MFPIDPRATIQRAQSTRARAASPGGDGFRLPSSETGQPARIAGAGAMGALDGLVALQADEDASQRRQRRLRRGHDLLDGLDRLKAALLGGVIPVSQLAQLKAQLDQRALVSDDPRLEELIGHIELRVAVELAKLGR
jgi:hypothetical protein